MYYVQFAFVSPLVLLLSSSSVSNQTACRIFMKFGREFLTEGVNQA